MTQQEREIGYNPTCAFCGEKNNKFIALCIKCLGNENERPHQKDLEAMKEGWKKGGLLFTNREVTNEEVLLLDFVEHAFKNGTLKLRIDPSKKEGEPNKYNIYTRYRGKHFYLEPKQVKEVEN